MRDARSQLADGLHFLRLAQLGFQFGISLADLQRQKLVFSWPIPAAISSHFQNSFSCTSAPGAFRCLLCVRQEGTPPEIVPEGRSKNGSKERGNGNLRLQNFRFEI